MVRLFQHIAPLVCAFMVHNNMGLMFIAQFIHLFSYSNRSIMSRSKHLSIGSCSILADIIMAACYGPTYGRLFAPTGISFVHLSVDLCMFMLNLRKGLPFPNMQHICAFATYR